MKSRKSMASPRGALLAPRTDTWSPDGNCRNHFVFPDPRPSGERAVLEYCLGVSPRPFEIRRLRPQAQAYARARQIAPNFGRFEIDCGIFPNQPDVKNPIGLRDRAMLEVLYSTGLRVSELIGLRVTDLDARVGCVRCIGKGDKERIVPVGKKALAIVEKYLRDARPKLLGKVQGNPSLFVNRRGAQLSRVGVGKILSAYGRLDG